jgi:hypothetical protein
MLLSLMLDKVALAKVSFSALSEASILGTGEWRLIVDFAHVCCIIGMFFEPIRNAVAMRASKKCTAWARVTSVVINHMKIALMLFEMIFSFKPIRPAIFLAKFARVSRRYSGMVN